MQEFSIGTSRLLGIMDPLPISRACFFNVLFSCIGWTSKIIHEGGDCLSWVHEWFVAGRLRCIEGQEAISILIFCEPTNLSRNCRKGWRLKGLLNNANSLPLASPLEVPSYQIRVGGNVQKVPLANPSTPFVPWPRFSRWRRRRAYGVWQVTSRCLAGGAYVIPTKGGEGRWGESSGIPRTNFFHIPLRNRLKRWVKLRFL